jgi:hemolysin activation/secretion protein
LDPAVKVRVSSFRISGNTAIDTGTLQAALAGDVGKELSSAELVDAAKKVRRIYTSRGYFLAVAYLPKQEIRDGVVEVAVVEGRLGQVRVKVAPGTRFSESQAQSIIDAHLKSGDLITEARLERPLLLIRDMAPLEVKSYLEPGKDLGTADLTVEVVPDPGRKLVDFEIDFDNHGVRFAGEHRIGATVHVNGPLSRGDRLSLRGQIAEEPDTNLLSLNYILPVGPYGTKLALSYANLNYRLSKNAEFEALDAHGDAQIASVNVIHPVVRRRDANIFVRAGYDATDARDFAGIENNKEVRAASIEVSGDLFDGWKGYSWGLLNFIAGDLDLLNTTTQRNDQLSGKTAGDFEVVRWSASRLQALPAEFFVLLSGTGQWASKNLDPLQEFFLGGPNAVRAYPVGDAPGDEGSRFTVEFRRDLPVVRLFGAPLTASLFYDWGRSHRNANPGDFIGEGNDVTLERGGYGIGLSSVKKGGLAFRVSVAWPDEDTPAPGQIDPAERDPRVYFQASMSF